MKRNKTREECADLGNQVNLWSPQNTQPKRLCEMELGQRRGHKNACAGRKWCKSNCVRLDTCLTESVRLGQNDKRRIRLFGAFRPEYRFLSKAEFEMLSQEGDGAKDVILRSIHSFPW